MVSGAASVGGRYPDGDVLLAEAVEQTGLSDFGPGDFVEGLEVLLESLRRDAGLAASTDAAVLGDIRMRLVTRLKVEAWLRDHPGSDSLPVRGPVDVMGLPRTGTTALANMMSLDPQFRCLREWEQMQPIPPPVLADEPTDPRYLAAIVRHDALPGHLRAMHLYDVDATIEDSHVLGMAFHGQQYTMPVYGYHAWWRAADSTDAFAYHRRVISLLQSRRPPDLWLFKSPHHKFHLEAIVAAYPDVRFVMTHRDPTRVVPSYASLVSALFPAAKAEHDMHRLGRELSVHLREGAEHAMEARARLGERRFLDVQHPEIDRDPLGTLRRVYQFLDLELRPDVEAAVGDWHVANRTGTHGAHRYSAEQFGLTTAQLRCDFDFYIRHFDIDVGE
jgi:hypothetical protein